MSTTVTNLSGDFNNVTNTYTPDAAAITLTRMTHAQFLAECPSARIPFGHQDSLGILKISNVATVAGVSRVRFRNLPGLAFTSLRNVCLRGYMPPAQAARWDAVVSTNLDMWMCNDAVGTYTNYYRGRALNYNPAGADVRFDKGNFHYACAPNAWSSTDTLLNNLSNLHPTPATGKVGSPVALNWIELNCRTDGNFTTDGALNLYIFDVVQLVESKPTLFFRFDDGNDEHYQVALHMRNATKFGGGSFARALPCSFMIPEMEVGKANRVTLQNLRDMVTAGATLGAHGNDSVATWATSTSLAVDRELRAWANMVESEGWNPRFAQMLAYIGNDYYQNTTDGIPIETQVAASGLQASAGIAMFGPSYPLDCVEDPLKGPGIVTVGQTSGTYINGAPAAETLMAYMDICRMSVVTMWHGVVPSAPGTIDVTEAQFDAIIGAFTDELVLPGSRIQTADLIQAAASSGLLPTNGARQGSIAWSPTRNCSVIQL